MPGIPKSCAICQVRKVKCDRRVAGCSQCLKYKWDCPGYPVTQPKVKRSRPPRHEDKNEQNIGYHNQLQWDGPISEYVPGRAERGEYTGYFDQSLISPISGNQLHDQSIPPSPLLSSPNLNFLGSPIALELVNCLSSTNRRNLTLDQLGSFIRLVPPRLGISNTLDDAVKCLCVGYSVYMSASSPVHYLYYAKALGSLRKSLYNSETALSTETLCASICLAWYKVLVDKTNPSWLVHTTGSARLIQLRGPEKHVDGLDLALLQAEHGLISAQALMERKPCFLSDLPWATIVGSLSTESDFQSDTRAPLNSFRYLDILSLIRKDMDDLEATGEFCNMRAIELTKRLKHLRQSIRKTLFMQGASSTHPCKEISSSSMNTSTSVIRCEDALAHISVNLAILNLRRIFEIANKSITWVVDILYDPKSLIENQRMHEGELCEFNDLQLLKNIDNQLNAEIEVLLDLSRVYYREATLTSPLSCLRLASICRTMYLRLETGGRGFHPVWHRIDALMREES